jgi:hypothetical protein
VLPYQGVHPIIYKKFSIKGIAGIILKHLKKQPRVDFLNCVEDG